MGLVGHTGDGGLSGCHTGDGGPSDCHTGDGVLSDCHTGDGVLSACRTVLEQNDQVQGVKVGDCYVDEQTSGGGQGWGQADNQVRCNSDGGLSDCHTGGQPSADSVRSEACDVGLSCTSGGG